MYCCVSTRVAERGAECGGGVVAAAEWCGELWWSVNFVARCGVGAGRRAVAGRV